MAGAGYKLFNTGDVLTAAQVNTYLQEQVVMVFANAAARTTALSGVLAEGMVSYLKDTDALEIYSGAAWVGYGSGDITGVTAGTGISGGGTSGTVTITNSMATEITAAGDIIVGTGSGTFDNLPIGTTGQVLTADTTVSPYKVKWAAASAASFVGCRLTKSANQSIATATNTAVSWDVEDYDTNTFHDNSTNNTRITIPSGQGGYYLVQSNLVIYNPAGQVAIAIFKNGTALQRHYTDSPTSGGDFDLELTAILNLTAGDYIEVYARQNSGGNRNVLSNTNDPANSVFQVVKLG